MADPKMFPVPPPPSELIRRVVEQALALDAAAIDAPVGRLVTVQIVVAFDERTNQPRAVSIRPEFKHDTR